MSGNIIINVPFSNFYKIIKPFAIGFDSMFDEFNKMLETPEFTGKYPEYKIYKKNENNFFIEIDIIGYDKKELKIETTQNYLTVSGINKNPTDLTLITKFVRSFVLTDNFKVKKAKIVKNILKIDLVSKISKKRKEKPNPIKIQ
jgi:HSP20 family molecular chaperone IbpA